MSDVLAVLLHRLFMTCTGVTVGINWQGCLLYRCSSRIVSHTPCLVIPPGLPAACPAFAFLACVSARPPCYSVSSCLRGSSGIKLKEMQALGIITVKYCKTANMVADLFTKNVNAVVFERLANILTRAEGTRESLCMLFQSL